MASVLRGFLVDSRFSPLDKTLPFGIDDRVSLKKLDTKSIQRINFYPHLQKKPSSYCPSSTTPRVALYPLQLDVVKHLVKLSPVGAVLACVFGNCILYGGNDYSSTMSGSFTDGLGSVQKHDADRLFFEFALDQSKRFPTLNRWIQMQTNLHRVSEVVVTAEHSVNDGIEVKTSVKRFREHDSDYDLEHDELATVGTNNLSVLTNTTNESGIWQDSPNSEAAEIDTTIFLSFGRENEKPYEKAVEKFEVVLIQKFVISRCWHSNRISF
ncbi:hypothetical protein Lser_V15G25266 [Lactuca serriola]